MMYECPECESDNLSFEVTATFEASVNSAGDVLDYDGGDAEWDDDSPARCCDCGHCGTVRDFETNDEEEDE